MYIPKFNFRAIPPCTRAHFIYTGEPKFVMKAREVSNELAEKMIAAEIPPVPKGTPFPYNRVFKKSEFCIMFGKGVKYINQVKKTAERSADMIVDYMPSHADKGMFPIFEELIYCKNDFSAIYLRAYPIAGDKSTPKVHYYDEKGDEIPLYKIVQWLPSADFQLLNEGKEKTAYMRDDDGAKVVKQDENGNPVFDENGNQILVPLPKVRCYFIYNPSNTGNERPLKIMISGENILNTVFDWRGESSIEDLENIKESYLAKIAQAEAKDTW